MVYKLVTKHKKAGKPKTRINPSFVKKVVEIRKSADYGSEKIHFVLKKSGFGVSQHIIQRILDEQGLTNPCLKLRGQRKYVRYQWPISNYMWHCDWSQYEGRWYLSFIDDRSRKIMASGEFSNATEENVIFLLYQAILTNEVCSYIVLSDKGTQFYNSKRNKKGELTPSLFEQKLTELDRCLKEAEKGMKDYDAYYEKCVREKLSEQGYTDNITCTGNFNNPICIGLC